MRQLMGSLTSMADKLGGSASVTAISILLALFIISRFLKRPKCRRQPKPTYSFDGLRRKSILSDYEQEFYVCLVEALPQHRIFVQVSLDALLTAARELPENQRTGLRNKFSQKHPDFVVCQKDTLEVVAIVELDDKTHNAENDRERDAMLEAVNYRVERFSHKDKPWREVIAKRFVHLF